MSNIHLSPASLMDFQQIDRVANSHKQKEAHLYLKIDSNKTLAVTMKKKDASSMLDISRYIQESENPSLGDLTKQSLYQGLRSFRIMKKAYEKKHASFFAKLIRYLIPSKHQHYQNTIEAMTKTENFLFKILLIENRKNWEGKTYRARKCLSHLYKNIAKGAKPMAEFYHAELITKDHYYGRSIAPFFEIWKKAETQLGFNEWLEKFKNTPFNEENIKALGMKKEDLEDLRKKLQIQAPIDNKILSSIPSVLYLNQEKRKIYQLKTENNLLSTNHEGLLHTKKIVEKPHIFVISPHEEIYVGVYDRGIFNHSSFLSGAPALSAGGLIFKEGKLQSISDKSGHYESNQNMMVKALEIFQKQGIDLSKVELTLNDHPQSKKKQIKINNALKFLEKAKATEEKLTQHGHYQQIAQKDVEAKLVDQAENPVWLLRREYGEFILSYKEGLNPCEHIIIEYEGENSIEKLKQRFEWFTID
jgi:hypothetical protein